MAGPLKYKRDKKKIHRIRKLSAREGVSLLLFPPFPPPLHPFLKIQTHREGRTRYTHPKKMRTSGSIIKSSVDICSAIDKSINDKESLSPASCESATSASIQRWVVAKPRRPDTSLALAFSSFTPTYTQFYTFSLNETKPNNIQYHHTIHECTYKPSVCMKNYKFTIRFLRTNVADVRKLSHVCSTPRSVFDTKIRPVARQFRSYGINVLGSYTRSLQIM